MNQYFRHDTAIPLYILSHVWKLENVLLLLCL